MKKNILFVLIVIALQVSSQNSITLYKSGSTITVVPNTTIYTTTQPSSFRKITIDIKNTSSDTVTYMIRRYDLKLNYVAYQDSAWSSFCFGGQCYPHEVLVSPFGLELLPGQNSGELGEEYSSLDADIVEGTVTGFSHVHYAVFNEKNPADSVHFSIRYNDPLYVGLNKNTRLSSSFSIFPNPAKEYLTVQVNSEKSAEGTFRIFNAVGELVIEKTLGLHEGQNAITIDLKGLSSGVYFTQLKSDGLSNSRKLIVQ